MPGEPTRHVLVIAPTARRQLTDRLPQAVAVAAYEFIVGPLLDKPHRVGRRLQAPWRIATVPAEAPTA